MSASKYPRYESYKDSGSEWLGKVPAHWEAAPLKRLLDIRNGADHKHIETEDGYPVIGSGGHFAFASKYMHDGESVLLGRKGTIDKPLYVNQKFWTVDTMYWSKISPDASGRFAYYATLTIPFGYYSTNTALPSMTKGALNSHAIARPPIAEQKSIAAFLDRETAKIDNLIAKQERLIELLTEKRQAAITQAVTKGLDPNVPTKDSGVAWLGEIPSHWGIKPLKGILLRNDGGVWGDDPDGENDVIVLRSTEQSVDGSWNIVDPAKRKLAPNELRKAVLVEGDLLLTKSSGSDLHIGKTSLVTNDVAKLNACYSNFMQRLRVNHLATPKFVNYILNNQVAREQFVFHSQSTTGLSNLNSGMINSLIVPVPPLKEQEKITEFLNRETATIDTLIEKSKRAIELQKEHRASLISAAVTGKIDVRGLA